MTYVLAGVLALIAIELWMLRRRVGQRLGALTRLEDDLEVRISSLTRSLELLTDTCEHGFNAMAGQLEAAPARTARATRQRRVTGAADRGRSVTEIAAQEELAESEVRLRLHLERQSAAAAARKDTYGAVCS
jgi:hypothetical protein